MLTAFLCVCRAQRLKSIKNLNHELDSCSLLLAKQVSRVTDLMPDPVLKHSTCFHPSVLEPTRGSEVSQRKKACHKTGQLSDIKAFYGINRIIYLLLLALWEFQRNIILGACSQNSGYSVVGNDGFKNFKS